MSHRNLSFFAQQYRKLGLNVTRMSNELNHYNFFNRNILKSPDHQFRHYFSKGQTDDEFSALDWSAATGVGTTAGFERLVVIDMDGTEDYELLDHFLEILGLPANYEWVIISGSRKGFHIIITAKRFNTSSPDDAVSSFKPNQRFEDSIEKIEFLWETNVVLPPSIHQTGNEYEFLNCLCPTKPPLEVHRTEMKRLVRECLLASNVSGKNMYSEVEFKVIAPDLPEDVGAFDYAILKKKNIFCVIDIETDGLITKKLDEVMYPAVVQVAWLLMDEEGTIYKRQSSLLQGSFDFENRAFKVNGITNEAVKKVGNDPRLIYKLLLSDLKVSQYAVFHNAEFDMPVLQHGFIQMGMRDEFHKKEIICTMKQSVDYCCIEDSYGRFKYPKLTELHEHIFGYSVKQQHNAESDILITAKCFKYLLRNGHIQVPVDE